MADSDKPKWYVYAVDTNPDHNPDDFTKLVEFVKARMDKGDLSAVSLDGVRRKNWRDALVLALVVVFFACVLWFAVGDIGDVVRGH